MVTGANFLLEVENTKILVDCGLIQGNKFAMTANLQRLQILSVYDFIFRHMT